ncbi:hypothetical protein GIB67_028321 [Kingdonia uniflora]|uniref:Uncharacterized protein n=1 Tax=Kingdonia uniflora TaxID=39325 RepID=A0A7J7MHN2_9MAGN|nr:hypothetical protein GIB67_028321 [Kingdonia uniflora]
MHASTQQQQPQQSFIYATNSAGPLAAAITAATIETTATTEPQPVLGMKRKHNQLLEEVVADYYAPVLEKDAWHCDICGLNQEGDCKREHIKMRTRIHDVCLTLLSEEMLYQVLVNAKRDFILQKNIALRGYYEVTPQAYQIKLIVGYDEPFSDMPRNLSWELVPGHEEFPRRLVVPQILIPGSSPITSICPHILGTSIVQVARSIKKTVTERESFGVSPEDYKQTADVLSVGANCKEFGVQSLNDWDFPKDISVLAERLKSYPGQ